MMILIVINGNGRQYQLQCANFTMNAVDMARSAANSVECSVLTSNVKNAFNSINWIPIKSALGETSVLEYLAGFVEN